MNIAFDPWIPVVTVSGTRELVSLCSALTERDKYADLAVRPHERISLMRLFTCSAHAALDGPKDYDEWSTAREKLPKAALDYLTKWKDAFELFHPSKPWLQVSGLSNDKWTSVSKLNFALAAGNNSTLFDHEGMDKNRHTPLTDTILAMLTFQCFSTGGLIAQPLWTGVLLEKSSSDAPCIPQSMIHALLRADTLYESIFLNLPTFEDLKLLYPNYNIGRPVWELVPISLTDLPNVENATTAYLGRLVPMARLIRIDPPGEQMFLGNGFKYPRFPEFFPEQTATVVVKTKGKQEGQSLLSAEPTKALWRMLAAMIVKRRVGAPGGPISLNALQEVETCDLIVTALLRKKASIIDAVESVFHIPATLTTTAGAAIYEQEVESAEHWARRLGRAIEDYRRELDGGWEGRLKGAGIKKKDLQKKLHEVATTHYWTSVEQKLALLMKHIEAIGTDDAIPTRDAWRKMLKVMTCDAYRLVCHQSTTRQIKAFAKGWERLIIKKSESKMGNTETKKENS